MVTTQLPLPPVSELQTTFLGNSNTRGTTSQAAATAPSTYTVIRASAPYIRSSGMTKLPWNFKHHPQCSTCWRRWVVVLPQFIVKPSSDQCGIKELWKD